MPCYVQEITPGDFIKIDVSSFTRTLALNTAAYARVREKVDFYYVPYNLIWRHFSQFFTSVRDLDTAMSSVSFSNPPANLPYLLGSTIYTYLTDASTDIYGFSRANFFERLLDMLGFPVANGDFTVSRPTCG